jgi:hypothetical protein
MVERGRKVLELLAPCVDAIYQDADHSRPGLDTTGYTLGNSETVNVIPMGIMNRSKNNALPIRFIPRSD